MVAKIIPIILAIIAPIAVFASLMTFYLNVGDEHDLTTDQTYNETYLGLNKTLEPLQDLSQNIKDFSKEGGNVLDKGSAVFGGVGSALSLLMNLPSIVVGSISMLAAILHIPVYFTALIILAVVLVIGIIVLRALRGFVI